MKRLTSIGLVVLSSFVLACGTLPIPAYPTPTRMVGYHISEMELYDEALYFGAGYCLYRLDTQNRALDQVICTENWTFQRPAVDEERAYVQVLTSPEASQFFTAIDLSTGTVAWRVDESEGVGPYWREMKDSTFLVNDQVIMVRGEWSETEQRIYVFNAQSGHQIWRTELNYFKSRPTPFLIHDNSIWYVIDGERDRPENGMLVAVDLGTGQTQQTIDLQPDAEFDELLYVDDRWIVGLDERPGSYVVFVINRIRPNQVLWEKELTFPVGVQQLVLHSNLFVFDDGGRVVCALDADTGQTAWQFSPDTEYAFAEDFEQTVFFVLSQWQYGSRVSKLYALDAMSGTVIWEYEVYSANTQPIVGENVVYVANQNSIDALGLNTGQLLWQIEVDSQYEFYSDPF